MSRVRYSKLERVSGLPGGKERLLHVIRKVTELRRFSTKHLVLEQRASEHMDRGH